MHRKLYFALLVLTFPTSSYAGDIYMPVITTYMFGGILASFLFKCVFDFLIIRKLKNFKNKDAFRFSLSLNLRLVMALFAITLVFSVISFFIFNYIFIPRSSFISYHIQILYAALIVIFANRYQNRIFFQKESLEIPAKLRLIGLAILFIVAFCVMLFSIYQYYSSLYTICYLDYGKDIDNCIIKLITNSL
jgi:hypothetical protein